MTINRVPVNLERPLGFDDANRSVEHVKRLAALLCMLSEPGLTGRSSVVS